MRCPILEKLSLEVLIHVQSFIDPPDIISLRKTCKQLANATQQRIVWLDALRRICLSHALFLPSFPVEKMSQKALEHAALSPYRFHSLMTKGSSDHPLSYFSTRMLDYRFSRTASNPDPKKFSQFRLIPGGRYLLTGADIVLSLWDLGFNAQEVVPRSPLASMTMKGLYLLESRPTLDGLGIMTILLSQSQDEQLASISVFTVYPLQLCPIFVRVAILDGFAMGAWWSVTDTQLAFEYLSMVIVWNFKEDSVVAWEVTSPDVDQILLVDEHIILFHPGGFSLFKVPSSHPHQGGPDTVVKSDAPCSLMEFAHASEGPYYCSYVRFSPWVPMQDKEMFFSVAAMNAAEANVIDYYALVPTNDPSLPTYIPVLMNSIFAPGFSTVADDRLTLRLCNGYLTQTTEKGVRQIVSVFSALPRRTIAEGVEFGTCKVVNLWEYGGDSDYITDYFICPATGRLCVMLAQHEIRIIDFLAPC